MKIRFNWSLWLGLLLSVFALISYPFVFVRWPVTRDFPWANLLIFGLAAILMFIGVRQAFGAGRRRGARILSSFVAAVSLLILGLFIFSFFIASRWLPAAHGAPQIGQKAPTFSLVDTTGKTVSLSQLLAEPINGKAPRGVLLIFYRGYW